MSREAGPPVAVGGESAGLKLREVRGSSEGVDVVLGSPDEGRRSLMVSADSTDVTHDGGRVGGGSVG